MNENKHGSRELPPANPLTQTAVCRFQENDQTSIFWSLTALDFPSLNSQSEGAKNAIHCFNML